MFGPVPFMSVGQSFYSMIQGAGAGANLDFCLDAADKASYDGTSQTWVDLTGAGNSFFLGTTSGSDATDPAFNGTAGKRTAAEYFSSDGGDKFTETAAHTFAESWHQDNGTFSIAAIGHKPSVGNLGFFDNANASGLNGVSLFAFGTTLVRLRIGNATSGALTSDHTVTIPSDEYFFVAAALDESVGANGVTHQLNATRTKATSTYSAPSAAGSAAPYSIGTATTSIFFPSGARLACVAGWSRRLSDAELDAIYAKLKRRYTTLP